MNTETRVPGSRRIDSIDLLRGIVMVVMLLDHTRDFVDYRALTISATDLTQTTTLLFLTRWVTHFCAPVFVFLAGTGAFLQLAHGKTKRELSHFLISRGLWLIFLEFTVIRVLALYNLEPNFLAMPQVIWVIGVSMIVLAALIYLPLKVTAGFGLSIIFLHNLFDGVKVIGMAQNASAPSIGVKLWMILHQPGSFPIGGAGSPVVFVLYPLIPWVGVMAVGYAFGSLYQKDSAERRRLLLIIGGLATALFVILRAIDLYGEPIPWSSQKNFLFTILSFVNTTKYPPSLLYLLMTLGPAIVALALFESRNSTHPSTNSEARTVTSRIRGIFVTFGRVPLFYYLLQWPIAHTISLLLHVAFGKPYSWLFETPLEWFGSPHPGIGFSLAVVYACWIAGVIIEYPLCKWFAGLKQRRHDWWLSYL